VTAASKAFGDYLRRLRTERHWSLREVHRRTGGAINFSWLSRLEKGQGEHLNVHLIAELARAYSVPFADLCRRACPGAPA
jgi:transcriptional regulator with XRE-family HTH domain